MHPPVCPPLSTCPPNRHAKPSGAPRGCCREAPRAGSETLAELQPEILRLGRIEPRIGCAQAGCAGDVLAQDAALVERVLDERLDREFVEAIACREIEGGELVGIAERSIAVRRQVRGRTALMVEIALDEGLVRP